MDAWNLEGEESTVVESFKGHPPAKDAFYTLEIAYVIWLGYVEVEFQGVKKRMPKIMVGFQSDVPVKDDKKQVVEGLYHNWWKEYTVSSSKKSNLYKDILQRLGYSENSDLDITKLGPELVNHTVRVATVIKPDKKDIPRSNLAAFSDLDDDVTVNISKDMYSVNGWLAEEYKDRPVICRWDKSATKVSDLVKDETTTNDQVATNDIY